MADKKFSAYPVEAARKTTDSILVSSVAEGTRLLGIPALIGGLATASDVAALDGRLDTLEAKPAPVNYSGDIAALDGRVDALEASAGNGQVSEKYRFVTLSYGAFDLTTSLGRVTTALFRYGDNTMFDATNKCAIVPNTAKKIRLSFGVEVSTNSASTNENVEFQAKLFQAGTNASLDVYGTPRVVQRHTMGTASRVNLNGVGGVIVVPPTYFTGYSPVAADLFGTMSGTSRVVQGNYNTYLTLEVWE